MSTVDLEPVRAQAAIEEPLTLASTFRSAWLLFRIHAGSLLKLFAPIMLLFYSLSWLGFELAPAVPAPTDTTSVGAAETALLLGAFLNLVVGTCASSVLIGIGAARMAGVVPADESKPRLPLRELIVAGLLVAIIPVAFILMGPLIILLPLLLRPLLGPPVVAHEMVFEDHKLGAALRSARHLLAGHWGRVFLYLLSVGILLNLIASASLRATGWLLLNLIGGSALARFLHGFIAGGVEAILLAFLAAAALVVYLDLRQRAEVPTA